MMLAKDGGKLKKNLNQGDNLGIFPRFLCKQAPETVNYLAVLCWQDMQRVKSISKRTVDGDNRYYSINDL